MYGRVHNINTKNLVSITETNQNFSKVARMADKERPVVILKNSVPKYLLINFVSAEKEQYAADEDVHSISQRLIAENRQAYEELAKCLKCLKERYKQAKEKVSDIFIK